MKHYSQEKEVKDYKQVIKNNERKKEFFIKEEGGGGWKRFNSLV